MFNRFFLWIYNIWLALILTVPFWNQAVSYHFSFSLYWIIIFLSLVLYAFIPPFFIRQRGMRIEKIVKVLFIIFGIIVYIFEGFLISQEFFSPEERYVKEKIFLGLFYIPLIIFCYSCFKEDKFKISLVILTLLGLIFSVYDINLLFLSIKVHSREIFFSNPISISVLAGILFISALRLDKKFLKFSLLVTAILLSIISSSRGPIVSLFITLFLTGNAIQNRLGQVVLFVAIFVSVLILRNFEAGWATVLQRIEYISKSLDLIESKLLCGYGLTSVWKYLGEYPHNFIIQILFEGGFVSLVFYLLVFLLILIEVISREPNLLSQLTLYYTFILLFSFDYPELIMVILPLYLMTMLHLDKKDKKVLCMEYRKICKRPQSIIRCQLC